MWILHFLPDTLLIWFCNLLLLAGIVATVAGWFAHKIPLVYQYQLPLKIAGGVLLALGVYLRGGLAVEMEWRARVEELEAKIQVAEKASQQANEAVKERIVTRDRVIREKGETIIQRVEVLTPDPNCERLPREVIDLHNDAARMDRSQDTQKGKK